MRKIPHFRFWIGVFVVCVAIPLCATIAIQMSWGIGNVKESRQTDVVFGTESWWIDPNGEYYLQTTPSVECDQTDGVFYVINSSDCFAFTNSINYGLDFITRIPVLYDTAGCATWRLDETTGTLIITICEMKEKAYEHLNGKEIVFSRLNAPVNENTNTGVGSKTGDGSMS